MARAAAPACKHRPLTWRLTARITKGEAQLLSRLRLVPRALSSSCSRSAAYCSRDGQGGSATEMRGDRPCGVQVMGSARAHAATPGLRLRQCTTRLHASLR